MSFIQLRKGEKVIEYAPIVELEDGKFCVPQHYLKFNHTLESVEEIVADIQFSSMYPVFVCENDNEIYIQIGIIGFDNYKDLSDQGNKKIVYGRKWRVEKELPTSEIIQTVFLALKKAREHEVRERLRFDNGMGITTPFNTHHDVPLLGNYKNLIQDTSAEQDDEDALKNILSKIHYDFAHFHLESLEQRKNGDYITDLIIVADKKTRLPEIRKERKLSIILSKLSVNELLFEIMACCINMSDRHVDEHFRYKGFARFSRKNQIQMISKISTLTRKIDLHNVDEEFLREFEKSNYQTDETRVPTLSDGIVGKRIRKTLRRFNQLEGITPKNYQRV